MGKIMNITFIGLVSGMLGTGIGGMLAFIIKDISNRFLGLILEFSAGLMTAVVCFELIPEAFELGGVPLTIAGAVAGIVVIIILEEIIRRSTYLQKKYWNTGLLRAGILVATGIALHNLPEGFAVGSGFEASFNLGITVTAVIIIHDIPEGIAMAVPMRIGGFSGLKAFMLTLASGIPMGIGAFFGAVLGEVSPLFIAVCLGFAAGAMLYVVCGELVPESKKLYLGRLPSLGNVLGIICGIIISTYN